DVTPLSRVVLKLSRSLKGKQRSFNFPAYQISEVDEGTGETTLDHAELLRDLQAEQLFRDELDQLGHIDGIFDSLKPEETTKFLFKIALQFAGMAAEVCTCSTRNIKKLLLTEMLQALPGSAARLSFLIIVKTWELLEQQTRVDDVIREVLQGLVHIRDVVEVLGQASSPTLATTIDQSNEPINDILGLLESASVYIFNRLAIAANDSGPTSRDEPHLNDMYDVAAYLSRLEQLQKAFHASWSPAGDSPTDTPNVDPSNLGADEPLAMAWEDFKATLDEPVTKLTDPYEILNLLGPTNPSGYDPDQACLEATRETVLHRIITWTQNRKNSGSFMWVSGQAGMGKTAVAASLCQHLDSIGALAGSFFCRHDDPSLSDPLRLINNLVHEIASRCPPYAHGVANAIRANRTLCTSHLRIRYEGLVKGPLKRLKPLSAPIPLVVIVDALDECGDSDSRKKILHLLHDMSQLVSWLRVIITARPESDLLKEFRNHCPDGHIVHLQTYDASDDIRKYIQNELGEFAEEERWPDDSIDRLCMMAQSVFLWAALATKYIKKSTGPAQSRLQQVLENRKSPITDYFDALYTRALQLAMSDHNDDTKKAYTRCIGAILAVLEHEPLAILDLQYLLVVAGRIGQGTLERVVESLGPLVLVIDGQYVRFHHPSFKDYAADPLRSLGFHLQLQQHEADLANCCLTVMQQDLRFNICKLRTSHLLNSEVPDLKRRIHSCVGFALKYACIHWIDYFTVLPDRALVDAIMRFLEGPQLMYWIEVLSLLGRLDVALSGFSKMRTLKLVQFDGWGLIVLWAKDVQRFLLSFYDAISASTPHLYVSALAFAPTNSSTTRRMCPYFPKTLTIAKGADSTWHPCIKTIFHSHVIQSLAISPDGSRIITGYSDGSLGIWDKQTGARVGELLVGHTDMVACVVFSPSGHLAASSSHDTTVRVWDIVGGRQMPNPVLAGHSGSVNTIAFSPDGLVIASGSSDKTIRLWDPKAMRPFYQPYIGHSSRVTSVAFSFDGTKLVSGSWDKTIRIWSVDLGDPKLAGDPLLITGHSDAVTCVAFSPDGSKIISGSVDKTMQIWDAQTGQKSETHASPAKHSDTITSIAFSPDGKFIASSSLDGAVQLWEASTFAVRTHPFGHFSPVNTIAFSPDGSHLVSGSTDMTARVWEIVACPKVMASDSFIGHSSSINSIAISSDGTRIISGSSDNTVRMWDAQTGAPIGPPYKGHSGSVTCIAISPDGTRIISGYSDKTMILWDTTTHTPISSYQHNSYYIHHFTFSPGGALIAFTPYYGDYKIYVCHSTGFKTIGETLDGHSGMVNSIVFSPNGNCIASASDDSTVVLWDTNTHSRIAQLSGHSSGAKVVAFSPCGTKLVSGSGNGELQIWDRETSSIVLKLTGHYSVMAVSFCLGGSCVASGSPDGTVRLWNTTTGQTVGQPITEPTRSAQSIAFSSDGDYVILGSNNTIRVQSLDTHTPIGNSARDPPGTHRWPSNPHRLSPHPHHPGWVTHDQKSHVFWLPAQYQQPAQLWDTHKQVPHPQTFLDYSKFVHGTAWTSIARQP
ncbi:hypothetical protein FRC11_005179, partial [Ceratobasidium sp. 423]